MRRYQEYSNEELAALDDVGIQKLIDIEVAIEGIVPVPEPEGLTIRKAELKKTVTAYQVGGLIFKKKEDAEVVVRMDLMSSEYDYSGAGYDYRWVEDHIFGIETVSFYEQSEVRAAGQALREFNQRKDQYDRDKAVYDKYLAKIASCRDTVWQAVNDARKEMCRIETATQTLMKYQDLADGDAEVAKNFFRNTYRDQPEMIKAVLGEEPQEVVVG